MNTNQLALAHLAASVIGVNSSNQAIIDRMRKATDNHADGEPWCVCFVQWAVREVDTLAGFFAGSSSRVLPQPLQLLPKTESTQSLWSQSSQALRSNAPSIGSVVVWRLDANPSRGHCGIVTGIDTTTLLTVEGNTSATAGTTEAERNGNGIWSKRRAKSAIPGFSLLGYLLPWGA